MSLRTTTLVIWLCAVITSAAAPLGASATEPRPLFRFDGFDFGEAELSAEQRQRVFEAYQRYRAAVDAVVAEAAVELEVREMAEKSGRTHEQVRAELFPQTPVADAEVEQFYRQNRQRIPMPFAEVRGQIAEYLARERDRLRMRRRAEALQSSGRLSMLLPAALAPSVEIDTADLPTRGPADAPVTVVEFADFQCPHCKSAHPVVMSMLERFAGKVRVVFMHLPLNQSGISRKVAFGATCAAQQGSFWPYHDLAFERQAALKDGSPVALARDVGLDMSAFEACYASEAARRPVEHAEAEAERLGVNSTPTIFVNGQRLRATGGLSDDLASAIQRALDAS